MLRIKTICFLILSACCILSADNEWPINYGSDYSSFSSSTVLKPPLKLKWVTRVFDNFKSGPVVAEGKVVCMGRTGNLYCLDAETGEILWRHSIKRNFIPGNYLGAYSYGVRQAPCIWQGKVYANLFWNGYPEVSGMHCFDLKTGAVLWRKTAGYATARYTPNVVDGRLAYVSIRNTAASGTAIYQAQAQAWDAVTGDSLWTVPLGDTGVDVCWQIAVHDTLFALTGKEDAACKTIAIDKDGNILWQDSANSFAAFNLSYYQGKILIGRSWSVPPTTLLNSADGVLIRSDNNSGCSVPSFSGNRYWRRTYGKSPKGYNINTGALELTCANAASTTGCGNPTIANGYLYLGHGLTTGVTHTTMGHVLRAYNEVTGAVAWSFRMSSNACTAPAIAYDRLYYTAGGNGDLVYCFENAE